MRDRIFAAIVAGPEESGFAGRARDFGLTDRPAIAALHEFCADLMMLVGPMLWAALIVLFIWAEFVAK